MSTDFCILWHCFLPCILPEMHGRGRHFLPLWDFFPPRNNLNVFLFLTRDDFSAISERRISSKFTPKTKVSRRWRDQWRFKSMWWTVPIIRRCGTTQPMAPCLLRRMLMWGPKWFQWRPGLCHKDALSLDQSTPRTLNGFSFTLGVLMFFFIYVVILSFFFMHVFLFDYVWWDNVNIINRLTIHLWLCHEYIKIISCLLISLILIHDIHELAVVFF